MNKSNESKHAEDGPYADDPRLTAYALGELDGADAAEMEKRLRSTSAARSEAAAIATFTAELQTALKEELPTERNGHFAAGIISPEAGRKLFFFTAAVGALAAGLALCAAAFLWHRRHEPTRRVTPIIAPVAASARVSLASLRKHTELVSNRRVPALGDGYDLLGPPPASIRGGAPLSSSLQSKTDDQESLGYIWPGVKDIIGTWWPQPRDNGNAAQFGNIPPPAAGAAIGNGRLPKHLWYYSPEGFAPQHPMPAATPLKHGHAEMKIVPSSVDLDSDMVIWAIPNRLDGATPGERDVVAPNHGAAKR